MCVIAGYAGSRLAAPVIIAMIERQEGLAGGFYAGMAVVEPDSLHWRKVVGVMADLRKQTDAERLPGCVGVAHSRSKSGGDAEWAHPFVACFDSVAYVANGSDGVWKDHPSRKEIPNRLAREGHVYHAVSAQPIGAYPTLAGRSYGSRQRCHGPPGRRRVAANRATRRRPLPRRWCEMPVGSGGALRVAPSSRGRVRRPLESAGLRGHGRRRGLRGQFARGFPARPCAGGRGSRPAPRSPLTKDRLSVSPMGPASQAIVDDVDRAQARAAILEALAAGKPLDVGALLKVVEPLSPSPPPKVCYDPVYDVLHALIRSGQVRREVQRVPVLPRESTASGSCTRW